MQSCGGLGWPCCHPLHGGCPLLLAPQGPGLASGNARKLELGVCSGEECCQRLKWSHSPPRAFTPGTLPVLLLPGPLRSGCQHGPRPSAPAPLGASCGSCGTCANTGGSRDAWCPPPGAAQQQKELGTCPWHVLKTEVLSSPAAPRCSAGGIQANAMHLSAATSPPRPKSPQVEVPSSEPFNLSLSPCCWGRSWAAESWISNLQETPTAPLIPQPEHRGAGFSPRTAPQQCLEAFPYVLQ